MIVSVGVQPAERHVDAVDGREVQKHVRAYTSEAELESECRQRFKKCAWQTELQKLLVSCHRMS